MVHSVKLDVHSILPFNNSQLTKYDNPSTESHLIDNISYQIQYSSNYCNISAKPGMSKLHSYIFTIFIYIPYFPFSLAL